MPRFPGAIWRPIQGHTDGPMLAHLGAVLHVNESNGNLFNFFNNPANQVSAHFEIYKNGAVEQYLDTSVSSWCQMDGNSTYVSIETEGYVPEPLTPAQIMTAGRLYAWLHTEHGIPLQLADKPGEHGFGWHGMGGAAWGGHTGCPGDKRKGQRAQILNVARAELSGPRPAPAPAPLARPDPSGFKFTLYTVLGGKGPVYAFAPGRWRKLTTAEALTIMRLREAPKVIVQVRGDTLAALRDAAIGANA
jgi:hypothetical protein